jgi:ABC-type bacteriocin/lantibiotic exporter with double-glycine peptidase domain
VELKDVDYNIPLTNIPIIRNLSLTITPGCTILIKGESSSGKSTLLRLIAGIIEPDRGMIYVNDVSLKQISLNYYRTHVGQSLTEESPFEGSILDNITFGDTTIPEKQIYWALEKAGLTQFVKDQPKGLKTMLYPEGQQIPYVVAKKIVLARSIVRKPRLLILKDPLDHFNPAEAQQIIDFLTDRSNPWALVVVSQNERWIRKCSRIITMKNGQIINES